MTIVNLHMANCIIWYYTVVCIRPARVPARYLGTGGRGSVGTGVSSVVGSVALGPVQTLGLLDGWFSLDIVSLGVLGGEVESVKDGVDESDDSETD
jgi:hypothetical protein